MCCSQVEPRHRYRLLSQRLSIRCFCRKSLLPGKQAVRNFPVNSNAFSGAAGRGLQLFREVLSTMQ
eukprot:6184973-Pleurochrysis_carterae.AAC.1